MTAAVASSEVSRLAGSGPVLAQVRAVAIVRVFGTNPHGGDQHPVLVAAAALADQHRLRARAHRLIGAPDADERTVASAAYAVCAHDAACAVLINKIDRWVATELAECRTGVLHTHTLGQIVEQLAVVWTHGQRLAEARREVADPQVRLASRQLGELSRAYDDLLADVIAGRRQLPVYQNSLGPAVAA